MKNCIFCKIAAGEIPSTALYEDDKVRVILDLGPAARGHALVLPKRHYKDATTMPKTLLGHVMKVGAKIGAAQMKAFGYDGFNLIQNNGEAAGQSVFHFHLHVIPRKAGDGAVGLWKPGSTTPEEMRETQEKIAAVL
ncbi:MAG: HIT family protein [Lachnospiraceae bacterium]|nr:HIT family protein [Lachnospiraceae bacterium]